MKRTLLIAAVASCVSAGALAAFSMVQVANNSAGAGGFLTGSGSSDFITPDVAGNKVFAR